MLLRKEFNKILTIFDEVREDHGIVLFIYGKEGYGKTYILDEVTKALQKRDVICLVERLEETEPFIFSEILKQARNEVAKMSDRGIVTYLLSSADRLSESENTFLRVTEALSYLRTVKPVFIVLDDIDSCEICSLNLFFRIAHFATNKNLMIVATLSEKPINSAFQNIYTKLKVDTNLVEMQIEPLTKDEVANLLSDLGYNIPRYIVEHIYSDSEGIPSKIFQILKELERLGNIGPEKIWMGHYNLNGEAIEQQKNIKNKIENLDQDQKDILNAIAIMENNARFDNLIHISNYDDLKLSEILDRLIYYGLVIEDNEYFKIATLTLKKQIYEAMSIEERIKMHKKYAELLEKEGGDVIVLSEQYYLAHVNDKAVNYLINAALILMKSERFESALNRLLKAESISGKNNAELLLYTGIAYRMMGNYKKSIEYLEESLKYAPNSLLNEIELELADSYTESGKYDLALQYYKKLQVILADKKLQIRINFGLFTISWLKNDISKAREYIIYALKAAEEIGDKKLMADGYRYKGNIEYSAYNIDQAKKNFEKALELYQEINNIDGLSKTYNNIASIYLDSESLATAIEYYEKAAYYADLSGDESMLATVYYNLAELSFERSDLRAFLKYIQETQKRAETVEDIQILTLTYTLLGWYHMLKGEFEQSENYYKRCADIYNKIEDKYSYYRVQYDIQSLKLLINGEIDNKEIKNLNKNIKNIIEEKGEIEVLKFEAYLDFLNMDFKNSLIISKKIESIGKINMDIFWAITYQFSCLLFSEKYSESIKEYERIEKLKESSGMEIIDDKKVMVCGSYLKDREQEAQKFKEVDKFFDEYDLKFEKGKLYLWYGILKLKYEKDDSYIKRAISIFDSVKANAYMRLSSHYLSDQKEYPK